MRIAKVVAVIGILGVAAFIGTPGAGAQSNPPVTLSGKTNDHGTKDLSRSAKAKLKLEADDFYFSPTFIQVTPGQKVTITIKNEGNATHTFTSSTLDVNKTIAPGKTAKIKVTIPAAGGTVPFQCDFHEGMGMQGAFFTGTAPSSATSAPAAAASATVSSATTSAGRVLVDANGRTLYMFDRDAPPTIACSGGCASVWPPLVANGTPTVGAGLDASKIAVIAGPNGNQVTYAGHPLYLYSGDRAAGDVTGQGFSGAWWVLGTDGNKIM